MDIRSTPEFHGYTIGQNIVPYINKCIEETGECYIGDGVHNVGRNDRDWNTGNVWGDNTIQWGWSRKHNVKIIGVGIDKTILRYVDNVQSRYLLDNPRDYVLMLQTKWNVNCDDNLIEGITFDGNYQNNSSTSTLFGIRIRGSNNKINACKFINFGVGDSQRHECFVLSIGPIDKKDKGPTVTNCYFSKPGQKKNSLPGYVPETTFIAVGGTDLVVANNVFEDCNYNIVNQQSPLHGVTIGESVNAIITSNKFINFQGKCFYTDSWVNIGAKYINNEATNVWSFIHMSCQYWNDDNQISFNKDILIENNNVLLSNDMCYYQWDKNGYVSSFFSYIYDFNLNKTKYAGFENVIVQNNHVTLGYININGKTIESDKLVCSMGVSVVDSKKIQLLDSNKFTSSLPFEKKTIRKSFLSKLITMITRFFKFK